MEQEIKGEIVQIIREEEQKSYSLLKAEGCDYLNIRPINELKQKFLFIKYTPKKDRYKGYWLFESLFKVDKPNNFKVGDKLNIKLSLEVEKCK